MTPKEEAEKLLKEFGSRGTPFNDAGIFVSEMIYEIEKYHPNMEGDIWYWEKVKGELEKMSVNQKTNKEREILCREYGYEELEEKPINQKTNNESKLGHEENNEEELEEMHVKNEKELEKRRIDNDKESEKLRIGIERELSLIEEELEKIRNNQKFHLRIYDNHNYMDESEAYNHGQYDSYEEAMVEAQTIVDEFFEHNWKQGVTPDYLIGQYCLYGDDPIILPNEHGKHKPFSARTYAEISAVKICLKLENE
jgi:hypothetical protein